MLAFGCFAFRRVAICDHAPALIHPKNARRFGILWQSWDSKKQLWQASAARTLNAAGCTHIDSIFHASATRWPAWCKLTQNYCTALPATCSQGDLGAVGGTGQKRTLGPAPLVLPVTPRIPAEAARTLTRFHLISP